METFSYILKRLLQMVIALFVSTIIVFFMIRLIPGNPARNMLGDFADPVAVEALSEKMGLNKPLVTQYFIYLQDLLHLDFGNSLKYKTSVASLMKSRLVVTGLLTLVSAVLTVIISIPLGYIAGKKKDTWIDQCVRGFSMVGLALPNFWIGLLLLILFGVKWKLVPVSGWGMDWATHWKSLILPGITQAICTSAVLIRNQRNNVIEVKNSDYVYFARSKGLGESRIATRYIVRNAAIPTVTLLSIKIAGMLGGAVIIEEVFSLPGLGSLLVTSILARDYAVVQAVVLFFAVVVLVINLLTDILYSLLDPQVKLQ